MFFVNVVFSAFAVDSKCDTTIFDIFANDYLDYLYLRASSNTLDHCVLRLDDLFLRYCPIPPPASTTVRLTRIYHPQIEGKFTATPDGLTNIFYSCIDSFNV
jgi:hypothetical protein